MAEEEKDVLEESSASSESSETQEKVEEKEDDKDKNFSQLRKKHSEELSERDQKIAELEAQIEKPEERTLGEAKGKGDDVSKTLFNRDLAKATRKWNKEHKVSAEEWKQVQDKVSLAGDEDDDLIYEKITDAYESLPSVKEAREKELIEKGRNEGKAEFSDSEMDIGGGGEVVEGSEKERKFSEKETALLDKFGVPKEKRKQIK